MKKIIIPFLLMILFSFNFNNVKTIKGIVLNENLTIQDENNIIYNFNTKSNYKIGIYVEIKYSGNLNYDDYNQSVKVISQNKINDFIQESLFKDYYDLAYKKLKELTQEEKIGQLFLIRYNEENYSKYPFGNFLFFEKDFKNKTKKEVEGMINKVNISTKIPALIAVDEEGGSVSRISSNKNLVSSPFKSPQELYEIGGFEEIKKDTINKSITLSTLGINLNLAPVVDVSTNEKDYIYKRTIGLDSINTAIYSKTVIEASKNYNVSYTLKHFPGYSSNLDTHNSKSYDNRTYEQVINEILPFVYGINSGAEAVLISHNIVTSIDNINPASLSINMHNLLRNNLNFKGIIITDNLDMNATNEMENVIIKAILSGNNLIIVSDYEAINIVKKAMEDNIISEELIDNLALKIIAWKYYKGLIN